MLVKQEYSVQKQCKINKNHCRWQTDFFKMMQIDEFVWDKHPENSTVAKRRAMYRYQDASLIHSVLYRTGSIQQKLCKTMKFTEVPLLSTLDLQVC